MYKVVIRHNDGSKDIKKYRKRNDAVNELLRHKMNGADVQMFVDTFDGFKPYTYTDGRSNENE